MTDERKERVAGKPLAARADGLRDLYGYDLVAVIVSLLVIGAVGGRPWARPFLVFVFLIVFFLTMLTSGVSVRTVFRLTLLVPLLLAIAIAADVIALPYRFEATSAILSASLVLASLVLITRRLARHATITRHTVFGALCIYLFIGILFAVVYQIISLLGTGPFFAQTDSPSGLDFVYFSFVTITTLGFGDLSPVNDLGRMTAVVEAVGGQLYLVVVVALFVANLGRKTITRSPDNEGD